MILGCDYETCSAVNVNAVGVDAYARHKSTRVWCAVLAFWSRPSDKPDKLFTWTPECELPAWAVRHITSGGLVLAHNWAFEHSINRHILTPFFGWPEVDPANWRDTVQLAAHFSLPKSLEGLGKVLGVPVQKDMEGNALMKRLAKVKLAGGRYVYPEPTPEEMARLLAYCRDDVLAMGGCLFKLPKVGAVEHAVMRVDREINDRGVYLDQGFAQSMRNMVTARTQQLDRQALSLTHDLISLTGVPALKRWLVLQGVPVPSVKKRSGGKTTETETLDRAAVAGLLGDDATPVLVREVLALRSEASRATSLAKLGRVPEMVSVDGRLRFALRYGGAHTLRWSSQGLQLHNLPKSRLEDATEALRGAVLAEDLEAAATIWPDVLQGLSWLLRSMIASAPGYELIGGDYSAIEARVLAWLAGQHDVLQVFTQGRDIYVEDAARIGSQDRQLGKVQRLALGYGMGAIKFRDTALGHGVLLELKRAREVQQLWRQNNPKIVEFWHDLENAVATAMKTRQDVPVGEHILVRPGQECLRVQLPSGRCLHYWRPHQRDVVREIETVDAEGNIEVNKVKMRELRFYKATGSSMLPETTYGGKLAENVTQAVARDLLAEAMLLLRGTQYQVVTHVHDSIVTEVREGKGDVREFCRLVAETPWWADGLPVEVQGYRSRHFKG